MIIDPLPRPIMVPVDGCVHIFLQNLHERLFFDEGSRNGKVEWLLGHRTQTWLETMMRESLLLTLGPDFDSMFQPLLLVRLLENSKPVI